jgi:hypothetical protein
MVVAKPPQLMIDEVYGCLREMIQTKVSKRQKTITVSEMTDGLDRGLIPYLPLAINRLKDEWVVNEDETGGKFEINSKLFELSKIKDKPIQVAEVEAVKTAPLRRDRRSSKYEKQLKMDAKRFIPVIKKIVIELAEEHSKEHSGDDIFQFSSHVINRKIREQLGDVFDETLAMRTFVAMKELSRTWILKREIRPTKNIWFVNLSDVENEAHEKLQVVPSLRPRKAIKRS